MDSHKVYRPTPREREVLNLICEGDSTKQIAAKLGISFKTASCHRSRLLEKSGTGNVVLLFRWALENGHVTVEVNGRPTDSDASPQMSQ